MKTINGNHLNMRKLSKGLILINIFENGKAYKFANRKTGEYLVVRKTLDNSGKTNGYQVIDEN